MSCNLCDLKEERATMAMRAFYVSVSGMLAMTVMLAWYTSTAVTPLREEMRVLKIENETLKGTWCER